MSSPVEPPAGTPQGGYAGREVSGTRLIRPAHGSAVSSHVLRTALCGDLKARRDNGRTA
jgi:hypothetical protein